MAVLRPFAGVPNAYGWVGLLSPLLLSGAAVVLGRSLGVRAWSGREVLLGLVMLVAPGVPHAVLARVAGDTGIFHPEDIAGTAFVLLATAAAVRGKWLPAGLLLGGALLTRQWALLAMLPLLAAAPPGRRVGLAGTSSAVFAAVVLPFALADPAGTLQALIARHAIATDLSLVGHLRLSGQVAFTVSRGGPIFAALALSAVLAWRWQDQPPGPTPLVGGILACLCMRTILDSAFFAYYLVPISVFVVVVTAAGILRPHLGVLWLVLLSLLTLTSPVSGPIRGIAYAACVFTLSLAMGLWGSQTARRPACGRRGADCCRMKPGDRQALADSRLLRRVGRLLRWRCPCLVVAAYGFCLQHLRGTGGDWKLFVLGSEALFGTHRPYSPLPGGRRSFCPTPPTHARRLT